MYTERREYLQGAGAIARCQRFIAATVAANLDVFGITLNSGSHYR